MGQLTSLQTLPFFYLGVKKGHQIEELGRLENLRGELTIKHLQLVEKPNIYKLAYLLSHDESQDCEINDEHVLDGLQPHPNLKTLAVVNYLGTKFPSWSREGLLPNLRCKDIPSLGHLKFLRHLELIGFLELESIGLKFYGVDVNDNGSSNNNRNIQVFPSLKELVLRNMRNLIEWKGDEVEDYKVSIVWGHLHWDSLPSYQFMQLFDLIVIRIHGFGIEALPRTSQPYIS
uniref:R13L1/DRL21-like LRR repeat region domain-containing protein n=1 Tax=Solanum lycopersicum TaxID=4081 RepID=A0A3Q7IH96_SOLLC